MIGPRVKGGQGRAARELIDGAGWLWWLAAFASLGLALAFAG